ncbi:hypothetical protein [Corynebacterium mastitidis]|uniref:hypothetical protein n=1 Tax=Corynebacterium mastitidis TaxID=161890 RepID=UPI00254E2F77|nr:hypothetical protein [Corynebacterium mastitidis]MDK8450968.1 hypothetical protein [Corynebacterium mastitidis]
MNMELQFVDEKDVPHPRGTGAKEPHPVHKKIAELLAQNPNRWAQFPFGKIGIAFESEEEFVKACRKVSAELRRPQGPYQQSLQTLGRDKITIRTDKRRRVLYVKHAKAEGEAE